MNSASPPDGLVLQQDFAADTEAYAAFATLLDNVLGADIKPASPGRPWQALAFFAPDGRCVAGLEMGVLPLILDGRIGKAATIRSVATDQRWTGLGLFRRLTTEAIAWCDACSPDATLLYTASPSLYERFGFRPLPQHAFVGPIKPTLPRPAARRLDLAAGQDRALLRNLVDRRAPVSERCALLADTALILANIAKDSALELMFDRECNALAVLEHGADELVVVDVFAPRMPTLGTLMGSISPNVARVRCLFPPDRLGWKGAAEAEDTGLMIRGPAPPAMKQPFMFPPTSEF